MPTIAINYLEVLVDDEEATLEWLNWLCDTKHDIFTRAKIPRRRLLMESPNVKTTKDREVEHVDIGRNFTIRSKILTHFIKGKISLSPIETILTIPNKLESLESLVKLAWKKQDDGLKLINLTTWWRDLIHYTRTTSIETIIAKHYTF